ncbi:DNA excision repair protein ERCC-8 [Ditylenchus destructor]|uniref:DNA excision repair protein ERCC-8 n=1 Tax=Ditylenchus destructor TaxID=166010 RepID=A0AAD4R654_9BILA|nr:DNA excision repair protein ERCC-8 [Ditylenchus destructor]
MKFSELNIKECEEIALEKCRAARIFPDEQDSGDEAPSASRTIEVEFAEKCQITAQQWRYNELAEWKQNSGLFQDCEQPMCDPCGKFLSMYACRCCKQTLALKFRLLILFRDKKSWFEDLVNYIYFHAIIIFDPEAEQRFHMQNPSHPYLISYRRIRKYNHFIVNTFAGSLQFDCETKLCVEHHSKMYSKLIRSSKYQCDICGVQATAAFVMTGRSYSKRRYKLMKRNDRNKTQEVYVCNVHKFPLRTYFHLYHQDWVVHWNCHYRLHALYATSPKYNAEQLIDSISPAVVKNLAMFYLNLYKSLDRKAQNARSCYYTTHANGIYNSWDFTTWRWKQSPFKGLCMGKSLVCLNSKKERSGNSTDLQREIIDHRIGSLTASRSRSIPFSSQNAAGISAMSFDEAENRFLLCGSSRGVVSIVDFEQYDAPMEGLNLGRPHKIIPARSAKYNHKYQVTSTQFYPIDSELFATASMDKHFKIWDSNCMMAVEKFAFEEPISQFHWGVGNTPKASLIAIAASSSNISLLDPRIGSAMHQIRCKGTAMSVRWQGPEFLLLSGDRDGRVTLWDIRSGRSELAQLRARKGQHAHFNQVCCIRCTKDRRFIISMAMNRTLRLWDAQTLKLIGGIDSSKEIRTLTLTQALRTTFDYCDEGKKLRVFTPFENNVDVGVFSDGKYKKTQTLQGHFHSITTCVYRWNYQQLISSANDRLVLIWSPEMDERREDFEERDDLHKDDYSDED